LFAVLTASVARPGGTERQPAQSRQDRTDRPPADDEQVYRVVDALDAVAKETGKAVAQIAINWVLQRPSVATVIIGARDEAQLRQNLGATEWKLTPTQMAQLEAASAKPRIYPYWHQAQFPERNPFPTA